MFNKGLNHNRNAVRFDTKSFPQADKNKCFTDTLQRGLSTVTSAVGSLIPAIGAVWDPVAQFAHVDAQLRPSTLVLIGWAAGHGAVWT